MVPDLHKIVSYTQCKNAEKALFYIMKVNRSPNSKKKLKCE